MTQAIPVMPLSVQAAEDVPYQVTVNGEAIPAEPLGSRPDTVVYVARFAAAGPVKVEARAQAGAAGVRVLPAGRVADRRAETDRVCFTAPAPGGRVVRFDNATGEPQPLLLVLYDPAPAHRPQPGEADVYDITDYGARPSDAVQTAKLQRALDACAASPAGGTVYVPAGRYRSGTLVIRGRTRLYLAAGAVLQASDDPADLPLTPGCEENGDEGIHHSHSRLLLFDQARGAALAGQGTLDGNGAVLRNQHYRRVHLVDAHDCHDLVLEGVLLRNAASWTVHLLHSTQVRVSDLRIVDDWAVPNTDGVDPDACRNVLIERLFCYSGDDGIAIKTTGNSDLLQTTENVTVRDSVFVTRKTALKCGTETRAAIRNVTFADCDVVESARGIGLWMRDGSEMSNITADDIRMELYEIPREPHSGQPLLITNTSRREQRGRINNVRLRNLDCRAPWAALCETLDDRPLEHVVIDNLHWTVTPRSEKTDVVPLLRTSGPAHCTVRGLHVDWSAANPEVWQGEADPQGTIHVEH